MYSLLVADAERYSSKKLVPLASLTAADLGNIQVIDKTGNCFEAVKIKHHKPITVDMVNGVYRKIKNEAVRRYYILTTHEPICSNSEQVLTRSEAIHKACGCEVIVNGVLPSLKYYLRMVRDPNEFVTAYTSCLQAEFQRGSGIKQEHLEYWLELQKGGA
jgi:DNA (cytosine-5)-methyltransferase 1